MTQQRRTVEPKLVQAYLASINLKVLRRRALDAALDGRDGESLILATFADVLEKDRER